MKNISIWRDKKVNSEPFLDENIETDILIIGGGITGLSTAYFLRDKGYKVCLTEKNYIGNGVTTKSTGKITYLQDILKDIDNIDDYIKAQIEACNLIKKVIMENNIDCDYEEVYHYLDSDDNRKINDLYKKIKMEYSNEFKTPYFVVDTMILDGLIQSLRNISAPWK